VGSGPPDFVAQAAKELPRLLEDGHRLAVPPLEAQGVAGDEQAEGPVIGAPGQPGGVEQGLRQALRDERVAVAVPLRLVPREAEEGLALAHRPVVAEQAAPLALVLRSLDQRQELAGREPGGRPHGEAGHGLGDPSPCPQPISRSFSTTTS
jgi:hypothetical protein